ncbi:membrane protein [Microtetraspora sp. NBRC 13810]|uniref:FtsX-like permease family protein n=1 Tax=Microtetraspora sp. NBRC 13810 TaxID=3030990 RepID=UPI0024A4CB91|nr:FtsX-like permease family protein [Microtetraspora sp. NBRC 13810]GLW07298.1 membrane protein [Microtetraspora sp. NBRC 13810]
MRGRLSDMALGARLAFAGGRDGWTRTLFTALGVGIGVAMLLLAAAVPGALQARDDRGAARSDLRYGDPVPQGDDTVLVAAFYTSFRSTPVYGRIVRPEGPRAPVPPGVGKLPGPGEVVVSPALEDLLGSPDGRLFAPRLGGARVIGTIADEGLNGPGELAFYLGSDTLPADRATRLAAFGVEDLSREPLGPVLTLFVVIIFVVLLLPVAVFLGAAVRFGGERRDRRLAALRLVGADRGMIRWIATGEAMVGALLGLAVGAVLFLAGRELVPLVALWDISVYASDVRPGVPLVVVIALAVPVLSAVVSLVTLRGVSVEPLGVTRRATPVRRRLWWRLVLPVLGLAALWPVVAGRDTGAGSLAGLQVAAGAVLLLVGAVALLPWVIDLFVRRLRGGPVGWQLATRRLQLDSGTSARLVSGIAVAVAGAIGLQMMFAGVAAESTTPTGQDVTRAQAMVTVRGASADSNVAARLRATPGVTGVSGTFEVSALVPAPSADQAPTYTFLRIGECASLAEFARLGRCADGDVFLAHLADRDRDRDRAERAAFRPGARLTLGEHGPRWKLPAAARTVEARPDAAGQLLDAVLVTPRALAGVELPRLTARTFVRLDHGPDTLDRVRNTVAAIDPQGTVDILSATVESNRFTAIRRGLYAGVVVTLLLIGASMLVGILEQLRERRGLLAALAAVGTRRSSLTWSVLWQAAIPVLIGLALATIFGLCLGGALLRMVALPISVDWQVVGLSNGLGAAVVLLMTLLSLPALWRLTRPDGLRTE